MFQENLENTFTAYFDDSEGVYDKGHVYTVIAAVLIRQDLSGQIEAELGKIWEKYLPEIDITEFHATDLEEATKWPFSTMANGEPLKMQKEFIRIIGSSDLPAAAVTIDSKTIQSNPMLGEWLKHYDNKVLAASLLIGICISSLIDVSKGECLRLAADEGLIQSKKRRTMEQAIEFLRSFGAKDFSGLAKSAGFVPTAAMDNFAVDAGMPEVASHESAGIQLADHVARYVFVNAKSPCEPDPRYLELGVAGLLNLSRDRNSEILKSFLGVNVHLRPRKGTSLGHANQATEKARLGELQIIASQFGELLQTKLNKQYECPNCGAKLFWGSPTKEIQNAADKGELQIVASSIKQRNYCPRCKTVVFTMADYAKELQKIVGQSQLD